MIGLVIATHSRLAEEFLRAAEMIIGPVQNARAVCIQPEDSVEAIRGNMLQAMQEAGDQGAGVVIMTDMFGGTPANLSISFLDPHKVEVLTGVNLPMVLKFFNSQEELTLPELVAMLKAYGQQSISLASEFLQKQSL
ncbi:MAG: PTS sugar transporter subunit IIA [Desulfuromonadales bacterium]|nr:PTS sugar transporter subunit IIA [Desulfuromonadales bacterium]